MAQRVVTVSDLSGSDIPQGEEAKINVLEYPELSQQVVVDASQTDVDRLKLEAQPFALVEIVNSDGSTERLALSVDSFKRNFKSDVDEVLAGAETLHKTTPGAEVARRRGRRPRGEGAPVRGERIDYSDVRFAGRVKRGIVSDAEKQTVRDHFDEVNKNLAAAGQRTLELSNIEHVTKYGLEELAKGRGITPSAK